ncbi:hypothetical protein D3C85_1725320 [compost metagenome]
MQKPAAKIMKPRSPVPMSTRPMVKTQIAPPKYAAAITTLALIRSMAYPTRRMPARPPSWNIAVTIAARSIVTPASLIRVGIHPVKR